MPSASIQHWFVLPHAWPRVECATPMALPAGINIGSITYRRDAQTRKALCFVLRATPLRLRAAGNGRCASSPLLNCLHTLIRHGAPLDAGKTMHRTILLSSATPQGLQQPPTLEFINSNGCMRRGSPLRPSGHSATSSGC